ncbi:MAG: hypothetical protein U1F09_16290 [Steroidobacteraceae bacterium]
MTPFGAIRARSHQLVVVVRVLRSGSAGSGAMACSAIARMRVTSWNTSSSGDHPDKVQHRVSGGQQDEEQHRVADRDAAQIAHAAEGPRLPSLRQAEVALTVALTRFQPVCPVRSRTILRLRLARVVGKGSTRPMSGSSAV